jgi:hypothetical protein
MKPEELTRIREGRTVVVDQKGTTWTVDKVRRSPDCVSLSIRCKMPHMADTKRSIGQLTTCDTSQVWLVP